MPEIVGPFEFITTTVPPLDAHITHLRHLTNTQIGRDRLKERFRLSTPDATKTAKIVSAHIGQSLEFHRQGCEASAAIRPVLQYYCYLNLAVAAILSYRPTNFEQYRRHGVVDCTHALSSLDLSSLVVEVSRGAVPLFHSIISDDPLKGRSFRLNQLAAGFHLASVELKRNFGKVIQSIVVSDQVKELSGVWYSEFSYQYTEEGQTIGAKRLERAMPLLSSDYRLQSIVDGRRIYQSQFSWTSERAAEQAHKTNGLKLINYGGHSIDPLVLDPKKSNYCWRGISRVNLLPTLSSILLMAFSLLALLGIDQHFSSKRWPLRSNCC